MQNVSTLKTPTMMSAALFIFVICLFGISAANIQAATFTVTSTDEYGPGGLRQALNNAELSAGSDTIVFNLGSCPCTITTTSRMVIDSGLTITGPGPDVLTIFGSNQEMFLNFHTFLTIEGLTLSGGRAVPGYLTSGGGAIGNYRGTTTLKNVKVIGNTGSDGGGIHSYLGTMSITNSTISGNSASGNGGGIYIQGGDVTIIDSVISQNFAPNHGGGIHSESAHLNVYSSTISGNRANGQGGGIQNVLSGQLRADFCTLSDNSARWGGGIYNVSGGAITNSTISGNKAIEEGGGFANGPSGAFNFVNSTITGNHVTGRNTLGGYITGVGGGINAQGFARLYSTIVAGNVLDTGSPGSYINSDINLTIDDSDYSLIGDAATAGGVVNGVDGNIVGADPMLGPLRFNGGKTRTHALNVGSPAIDSGYSNGLYTVDQRVYQRTYDFPDESNGIGDGTDIGAYELDPDTDGDGVRDFADNCPTISNPEKIAFSSNLEVGTNVDIYVMNPDGSNTTRLTNNAGTDQYPAFSADGSKIAFVSDRDGNSEIYVMNSDGTGQTNLTNNPAVDSYPAFSPDGSKIAFTSFRDGNPEIYVMNSDGTNLVNLTNNEATDGIPAFSPDGSKIAFLSVRDGNREIYVMNADGSAQTNLTHNAADDLDPTFSPDGSKIAFTSLRDGNSQIFVMNVDGTGQTNLSNNLVSNYEPAFSPDGSKITYHSYSSFNYEVHTMNWDGTNQTNLTNRPRLDFQASWGPQQDSDGDGIGDVCENTAPVANGDHYTAYEDELLIGSSVLANDTDGEGNGLTAVLISGPVNSQAFSLNPDGTFSYTANANYTGFDFFTYKANDGALDSEVVTVTITNIPINDAPTISSTTISRQQAAGSSNSSIGSVGDIDNPAGDLVVTVNGGTSATVNGVTVSNVSIDGSGNVTADTSAACGASSASFQLRVNDTEGRFAITTLNVTVTNETTAPVINPISNLTVYLPANSPASSMVVNFLPTATDDCSTPVVTTSPVSGSVFGIGTTTVNVTAEDAVGNTSTATFTVTVLYNFGGFLQPVDSMPTLNIAQPGSSIPVKFSLSGSKGLGILAAGYPVSAAIPCSANEPGAQLEETDTAGNSGLTYESSSDQYKYVWKTNKAWKGTCRLLVVRLTDGSEHYAKFRFK